jgi:hypothetical protein
LPVFTPNHQIHAKIHAMQLLQSALQTLQEVPPPPKQSTQQNQRKLSRSFSSVFFTEALPLRTALNDFGGELHNIQNQLAMAFPFIEERREQDRNRLMSTIRKRSSRNPSMANDEMNQKQKNKAVQSISKAANTFGKMVKKRVNTVVERAGAAVSSRIGGTELETYTQLLCAVFDQCQFIDRWLHGNHCSGQQRATAQTMRSDSVCSTNSEEARTLQQKQRDMQV